MRHESFHGAQPVLVTYHRARHLFPGLGDFRAVAARLFDTFGRKKIFLNALFNGVTLGALYFLVASGFTLIFGLMKNVNLAHGSLYLLGGYIGYDVANTTGWWLLSFVVAFVVVGAMGVLLQVLVFQRMEGEDFARHW